LQQPIAHANGRHDGAVFPIAQHFSDEPEGAGRLPDNLPHLRRVGEPLVDLISVGFAAIGKGKTVEQMQLYGKGVELRSPLPWNG
jgi:hypothetical protein